DGRNFLSQNAGRHMEDSNHGEHQRKTLRGRKLVPVRGDKEQNAGAEHKRAKADGEHGRPAETLLVRAIFKFTDAVRGERINQVRVNPALKMLFPSQMNSPVGDYARKITRAELITQS